MKKNVLSIAAGALLLATTTGCLEKKEEANQASNREALIASLDNQAVSLVDSLNKVIISGDFFANLSLENPPEPIPLEGDADVKKAIDYLFANEVVNGSSSTYTPDPRICSEVLAKEHPATCEKVFAKVSFIQEVSDEDTGYVQMNVDGSLPLGFVYDSSLVSFNLSLPNLFEALEKIDAIRVAAGDEPFSNNFPSTRNGAITLTVANQMGASVIDFTISQTIEVAGVTSEGHNYALNIPAANNVATVSLISGLGIGTFSLNAPAATALFPVHDGQEVVHSVSINFPGLSGQASLNNAASLIDVSALQLNAASVSAVIDGQPGIQLDVAAPLNAQIHASAGDLTLQFTSAFDAYLQVSPNSLIDKSGTVTAAIAQDTSVLFAKGADQAKLLNGSFSLIGTGDFTVNLDAQAGMCIEGQDEPFALQTVTCQ